RLEDSSLWLHAGPVDRPPRHRTLAAAIRWSYALLDEAEQRLFRYLAPFVGGCDHQAAAALSARLVPAHDVELLLESLIEQNLVMATGAIGDVRRCTLLMTMRDHAAACLREQGELSDAHRRHAEIFLARAEALASATAGPGEAEALARMRLDQANLREALDW